MAGRKIHVQHKAARDLRKDVGPKQIGVAGLLDLSRRAVPLKTVGNSLRTEKTSQARGGACGVSDELVRKDRAEELRLMSYDMASC